ncbi:MAG: hypothetical protein WBA74_04990, partial [Cyclobacteriaceae bacterium]
GKDRADPDEEVRPDADTVGIREGDDAYWIENNRVDPRHFRGLNDHWQIPFQVNVMKPPDTTQGSTRLLNTSC